MDNIIAFCYPEPQLEAVPECKYISPILTPKQVIFLLVNALKYLGDMRCVHNYEGACHYHDITSAMSFRSHKNDIDQNSRNFVGAPRAPGAGLEILKIAGQISIRKKKIYYVPTFEAYSGT